MLRIWRRLVERLSQVEEQFDANVTSRLELEEIKKIILLETIDEILAYSSKVVRRIKRYSIFYDDQNSKDDQESLLVQWS